MAPLINDYRLHNFCESDAQNKKNVIEYVIPFYEKLKLRYPGLFDYHCNNVNCNDKGVDTFLTFGDKTWAIDEKVRFSKDNSGNPYDDCLIEDKQVYEDGTTSPGWTVDTNKQTQKVLYMIPLLNKVVLLDYKKLQKWWNKNSKFYYNKRSVPNKAWDGSVYRSENYPVEWRAIRECIDCEFDLEGVKK